VNALPVEALGAVRVLAVSGGVVRWRGCRLDHERQVGGGQGCRGDVLTQRRRRGRVARGRQVKESELEEDDRSRRGRQPRREEDRHMLALRLETHWSSHEYKAPQRHIGHVEWVYTPLISQ
jgi:hypothetical protein